MSALLRLANALFAALLWLYPRSFRDEFRGEMRAVLAERIADAATRGVAFVLGVCWHEVRDAPMNILREHWRERRRSSMERSRESPGFERISWLGVLAALTPFLLIGIVGSGQVFGAATGYVLLALFVGLIFLMVSGLWRGGPAWSLPILGFIAGIMSFFTMGLWAWPVIFLPPSFRDSGAGAVLYAGLPWLSLILWTLLAFFLLSRVRPTNPLYQRLRGEWASPAFALYGACAFWLWITYDEWVGEWPYVMVGSLILIAGAVLYLFARRIWLKFAAIAVSVLVVVLIVAWSKWTLFPIQPWRLPLSEGLGAGEVSGSLLGGAWMMFTVLIFPALLNRAGRAPRAA